MDRSTNIRKRVQDLTDEIEMYLISQYGEEVRTKDVQVRMTNPSQINYRWLAQGEFPEETGNACCEFIADEVRKILVAANYPVLEETGVEFRIEFRSRESNNPGNKIKTYLLKKDTKELKEGSITAALNSCRVRDLVTGREFDWTPLARGLEPPAGLMKL